MGRIRFYQILGYIIIVNQKNLKYYIMETLSENLGFFVFSSLTY